MQNNVKEARSGIIQIKAPLPFPLRWVNSYLIYGDQGITVIDPGLHTIETEQLWVETAKQYGFLFTDIEQIVLTHHHPDHYGMAGWLQQQAGGIPVWISRTGYEQAQRLWGADQPLTAEIARLFIRNGMDAQLVDTQLVPHMAGFVDWVSPQPIASFIQLDEPVRLGNQLYKPILTPGHAAGHLCFYDEINKEMFCGDHILPQLSPNISYIPGADENPLLSFLTSLEDIKQYEVVKAYPGHREPFTSFQPRVLELIAHHKDRLAKMLVHLQEPKHVYQLCIAFFGDKLPIHQLRFAMSETLAHVIFLLHSKQIVEEIKDGISYYSTKKAGVDHVI